MGELTAAEERLLDDAGLVEPEPGAPDALAETRAEYEQLLRDCLTIDDVATLLGLKVKIVRARLNARTIYGVQDGPYVPGTWHVPRFQFESGKLVAGMEQVLPRIHPGTHPLAVQSWFTLPHPDLVVGEDEQRVSPLDWLRAGKDPEPVAQLAAKL